MTNDERRQIIGRARTLGYEGNYVDLFNAYARGEDPLAQFEQQLRQQAAQQQAQQMQVARTPEEQSQGLIPFHKAGQTDQSMAFPNVQPGQSFTTKGLTAPIDMTKVDHQGNVVESYKAVQPGIANIPTGPYEGTMIETPAKSYQTGGQRQTLVLPDDEYGRMRQQAYADSLSLYKQNFNQLKSERRSNYEPIEFIRRIPFTSIKDNEYPAGTFEKNDAYDTKSKGEVYPEKIKPIYFDINRIGEIIQHSAYYKKPVQPIELQKGLQKLNPKESLLPTSNAGLINQAPLPLSNDFTQNFGNGIQGTINSKTGEWSFKDIFKKKRPRVQQMPVFEKGGAKCYTCGGMKAKVRYNKLGYKK
jgi:uncharacterized membrane protein (UPF0127 family)